MAGCCQRCLGGRCEPHQFCRPAFSLVSGCSPMPTNTVSYLFRILPVSFFHSTPYNNNAYSGATRRATPTVSDATTGSSSLRGEWPGGAHAACWRSERKRVWSREGGLIESRAWSQTPSCSRAQLDFTVVLTSQLSTPGRPAPRPAAAAGRPARVCGGRAYYIVLSSTKEYSQHSQFIKDKRLHVNTRNIQRQLYPCTAT